MNDLRNVAERHNAAVSDARFEERYPDDEISLFDLWAVLVRRKWLMAAVFLVVLGLALAYALIRPDVYTYSASIAIGRIIEDNHVVTIEPPTAVRAALEQAYIPTVIRERVESAAIRASIDIKAAPVEGANMITLSAEAPEELGDRYLALIREAAQQVIADHQERIHTVREITTATIQQLEKRASTYQTLIDTLRAEQARLDARAGDLRGRTGATEQPPGDNTAPQAQQLTQAQDFTLPLRAWAVSTQIANLHGALAGTHAKLTALRARLAAMKPTRFIGPPARSFGPSGPGGKIIVALGAVLGAMLAIFAAFAVEFVTRANSAIREGRA